MNNAKKVIGAILLVSCLTGIVGITLVITFSNQQDSSHSQQLYPVNLYGETYGKVNYDAPASQPEPDLIQAIGTDGTIGYVRADDLDSNPRTPAEALKDQRSKEMPILIPLYDKDGKTPIGEFLISNGDY